MSVIRLTEGDLRRVVRNVLSESMLLSEGNSARHFETQIKAIADDFWEHKDECQWSDVRSVSYPIVVSLKPFFKEGEVSEYYMKDSEYHIKIYYDTRRDSDRVEGSFTDEFMSNNQLNQIWITVYKNCSFDDLYSVLVHEVTHLVDYLIKECKNQTMHKYPINRMQKLGISTNIVGILYWLWNTTEFNAWKSTYKTGLSSGDEYFERIMNALRSANNNNDEEEWSRVRDYVAQVTSNPSIANKSPMAFKDYFIKTSFRQVKKMVRKYY